MKKTKIEQLETKIKISDKIKPGTIMIYCHPTDKSDILANIHHYNNARSIIVEDERKRIYKLNENRIFYIEIIDHHVFVYTQAHTYFFKGTLKEIKGQLTQEDFIQITKGTIVNRHHIITITRSKQCRRILTLSNGENLVVNRNYKNNLSVE